MKDYLQDIYSRSTGSLESPSRGRLRTRKTFYITCQLRWTGKNYHFIRLFLHILRISSWDSLKQEEYVVPLFPPERKFEPYLYRTTPSRMCIVNESFRKQLITFIVYSYTYIVTSYRLVYNWWLCSFPNLIIHSVLPIFFIVLKKSGNAETLIRLFLLWAFSTNQIYM